MLVHWRRANNGFTLEVRSWNLDLIGLMLQRPCRIGRTSNGIVQVDSVQ